MATSENSIESKCYPIIDKGTNYTNPERRRGRRKNIFSHSSLSQVLAIAIMAIMIISSIAILASLVPVSEDDDQEAATILQSGQRELTVTVSNWFESYVKNSSDMGRHTAGPGLNEWFTTVGLRSIYQEWVLRNTYPYSIFLGAMSTMTDPDEDPAFYVTAPYRLSIEGKNISGKAGPMADVIDDVGTDVFNGHDPFFIPILGNPAWEDAGWVNMSWYCTYLTSQDMLEIRDRRINHYANFYFDVTTAGAPPPASNDGYYHETQGVLEFDRAAARKLLGMNNAITALDIREEWNITYGSAPGNDVELAFFNDWVSEGGSDGPFNIYTGYDYANDLMSMRVIMDKYNSTEDLLILKLWSCSWGNDVLLVRYLEAANITPIAWQTWNEDWYMNMTMGPTKITDFDMRTTTFYHPAAVTDPDVYIGTWSISADHIDWCGNTVLHPPASYDSPYNPYDPDVYPNIHKPGWLIGTTHYGKNVSFWVAPQVYNLSDGDKVIIELPTTDIAGYWPYRGASDDITGEVDANAKRTELLGQQYWGEMILGNCYPDMSGYYDPSAKTLTIEGPVDFWPFRIPNGNNSALLEDSVPIWNFAISPVSEYNVTITEDPESGGPYGEYYLVGTSYTLRVEARNLTGATVTTWNGTVDISCDDPAVTLGASSHTFIPADNGVWTTSITFGTIGWWYVNASDRDFPLDVNGQIMPTGGFGTEDQGVHVGQVYADVPEFQVLLMPIIGAVAIFLVFRIRNRREEE